MQSIQQILTNVPHDASSVATALARPRTSAPAAAGGATGSKGSPTATDVSTITANDFLTLLVAEMKNQDPTQPTDPTAYISQMVNVNSLQQLIGINQGITSLDAAAGVSTKAAANAVGGTGS